MSNAAVPTHPDLKDTLEEMRASVAARGARKGLRGAIQAAILGFLEAFLALLADFRAGKLAPIAPVAEGAVDYPSPSLKSGGIRGGSACWANGAEGEEERQRFSARTAAAADGLPAESPIRAGRFDSVTGISADEGMTSHVGSAEEGANGAGRAAVRGSARRTSALSLRARRFGTAAGAYPAAVAAVAGKARHSSGFPALQGADSKNWVFGERESVGHIVPG
jgi:hypothetical protein